MLLALFLEVAKAIGADRVSTYIEPACNALFGQRYGHDTSVLVTAAALLLIYSTLGTIISREAWRAVRSVPIAVAARLRRRFYGDDRLWIVLADINGDRFGGRKKALVRELEGALRARNNLGDDNSKLTMRIVGLPRKLSMPDLENNGQIDRTITRTEGIARRWLGWIGGDVLIWGDYQRGDNGEAGGLFLTFVPRRGNASTPKPYDIAGFRISDEASEEIRRDLIEALLASALGQVSGAFEEAGQSALARILIPLARRLEVLIANPPAAFSPLDIGRVRAAYAKAAEAIGGIVSDPVWLQKSVDIFRERLAEPGLSLTARAQRSWNLAKALIALCERQNDASALREAISLLKGTLRSVDRKQHPDYWASIQEEIGIASAMLGEMSDDPNALDEAMTAFNDVLQIYGRASDDWAGAQVNRGILLLYSSHRDAKPNKVWEAVMAFKSALTVFARYRAPLDWALAQHNLGVALNAWGTRTQNKASLRQSLIAFCQALKVFKRDRSPMRWANSNMSMASSLVALGHMEHGGSRFQTAIKCLRETQKVFTRPAAPKLWADSQNRLGIALLYLGSWKRDVAMVKEAVGVFRLALEEYSPEDTPHDWAMVMMNLGNALKKLGEMKRDTGLLQDAIEAYSRSLAVLERIGDVETRDLVANSLAETRKKLERMRTKKR